MTPKNPHLRFERSFTAQGLRMIAGADEVGRGALAGPVTVGMVVVDAAAVKALKGVRDSKLLSPKDRELLVPRIQAWAAAYGVGHASPEEIDAIGLTAALRLAGTRAWQAVLETARPDAVILDGNFNWLSPVEQPSLFEEDGGTGCDAPVHTRIKADLNCLSVAAASVLAKVERDTLMAGLALEHPAYGWDINKGYATAAHRTALTEYGPSAVHRRSWRLMPDEGLPADEGSPADGALPEDAGVPAGGALPEDAGVPEGKGLAEHGVFPAGPAEGEPVLVAGQP
ncbi:ribonuclease HII [Arthrobacter crystallopoietes BAB-32]|uniref:Ribonuclease HII n=1 Tax=Arthrobacter crystallopoietes BAB-32 TaxID=1246476 RepID=N1V6W1_9MICC|nr:ribonuclease HII [Arthrobacter crystallopoietes BAB-32]